MVDPPDDSMASLKGPSLIPGDSTSQSSPSDSDYERRAAPNGDHHDTAYDKDATFSPGIIPSSSSSGSSGSDVGSPKPSKMSSLTLEQQASSIVSAISLVTDDGKGSASSKQGTPPQAAAAPVMAKRSPDDFIFEKVLGEGAFSTVYLARDIHTSVQWAVKVCEKQHIKREKKETYIKREKEIMSLLNANPSPFFVKLFCTFHDHHRLCLRQGTPSAVEYWKKADFVMTYARNGEILPYIHKVGCFDAECTKFYSGEVVLALEHLHKLGVIHRDLKPENILLNEHMHILITDFGSAKMMDQPEPAAAVAAIPQDDEEPGVRPRRNSFVGTADYVSPELLTSKETTMSSDLWALGCLIYQLLAGLPPFRAPNEYLIFQKIIKLEYSFPEGFNQVAKDLVEKLLVKDYNKRLGSEEAGGYAVLRAHPFYDGLLWDQLHLQKPPPITPYLPASGDNEELRSDFVISPNVRPGFDEKQLSRLLDMQMREGTSKSADNAPATAVSMKGSILDIPPEEYAERLAQQAKSSMWHPFVDNHLIVKQGIIDKRKGLFARRRMFLLTTGPHFYYVDPAAMVLKGEIPWSADMRPEAKNFKIFFVHTPNRTYYLEDPQGYALEWCRVIEEVRAETFSNKDSLPTKK